VGLEYDKRFQGLEEIREKHIKPEMAETAASTYKVADRLVRGQGGTAYVSERNIVEFRERDGKTYSSDSARASYVLEKQGDGGWKCKQVHWSGPSSWAPTKPEGKSGKK
jgi:ketosteroid isomerase-like protein